MSIPIEKDLTGWNYERTSTRAFPEIVISEGALEEAVQAVTCRHCGYHRVKLVGFGKEAAFARPVPPIMGMGSSVTTEVSFGEDVETLIFKCSSCGKEMKMGADDSMGLLSGLAASIEKDLLTLVEVVAEQFPNDYEEIKGGKKPVEVVAKLIRKYGALVRILKAQADELEGKNDDRK